MKKSLTVLLAVASMSVFAGDSEKDKLAEELVNLAGVSQNIQNAKKNISQMNERMFLRMRGKNDPKKIAEYKKKLDTLINNAFDWKNIKGEYIKLYAKTFTVDEMKGIIEFYKTPAGKLLRERDNLMRQEMKLMQDRYRQIMPQLRAVQMEMRNHSQSQRRKSVKKTAIPANSTKKVECSKTKTTSCEKPNCVKATAKMEKQEETKK